MATEKQAENYEARALNAEEVGDFESAKRYWGAAARIRARLA